MNNKIRPMNNDELINKIIVDKLIENILSYLS